MTRIRYKSGGGPKGSGFQPKPSGNRPTNPRAGETIRENGCALIYTGRDWAWFPTTASDLIKFARMHGWKTKTTVEPKYTEAGRNAEGDKLIRTEVKIVLLIGRESGATTNRRESKGYLYRLVWDTSRTGVFDLVSWNRRTTTDTRWVQLGSIAEIRPIIARNPVLPERTGTDA
jgi:hypothetical protein